MVAIPTHIKPSGEEGWFVYDEQTKRRVIFDGKRYWMKAFGRWYPQGKHKFQDEIWHPDLPYSTEEVCS